jgi:hypothetical protein
MDSGRGDHFFNCSVYSPAKARFIETKNLTKDETLNPPSPPFTKGGKVIYG